MSTLDDARPATAPAKPSEGPLRAATADPDHPCPYDFTERRILQGIANGRDTTVIATQVRLAHVTVQRYLRLMIHRTGATDRAHLVATALRNGWIR